MSCNRLYGGQKKNKQASLRKRSGGNPVGLVNGQDETTDGQNPVIPDANTNKEPVSNIIKEAEPLLDNVASAPVDGSTNSDASTKKPSLLGSLGLNNLGSFFSISSDKGDGNKGNVNTGGKRRTQRKQQNQRKTHKAGGQKTLIGGIFSKTCVHCVAMQGEWKKLQKMLKQHGGNILMKNVEAEKMDQQLPQVNKQFLGGSDQRVEMQGGFPTLFKIKNKKVEYYGGERTADAMLNWALQ